MSFAVPANISTGGLSLLAALFSAAGFALGALNIALNVVLNLVSCAVLRRAAQLEFLSMDQLHVLTAMSMKLRTQAAGIGLVFFVLDCLLAALLIWKIRITT